MLVDRHPENFTVDSVFWDQLSKSFVVHLDEFVTFAVERVEVGPWKENFNDSMS